MEEHPWIRLANLEDITNLDRFELFDVPENENGTLTGRELPAFRKPFISLPWHAERPISLDTIEHEILRRRHHEKRIHFAIVCASKGCPILRSEPYLATQIDAQLDSAAKPLATIGAAWAIGIGIDLGWKRRHLHISNGNQNHDPR